jgi:hypothetical protein
MVPHGILIFLFFPSFRDDNLDISYVLLTATDKKIPEFINFTKTL